VHGAAPDRFGICTIVPKGYNTDITILILISDSTNFRGIALSSDFVKYSTISFLNANIESYHHVTCSYVSSLRAPQICALWC